MKPMGVLCEHPLIFVIAILSDWKVNILFGIFYVTEDKHSILGTSSGEPLWFDTLDEAIEFIQVFNIKVYDNTVIWRIIGDFLLDEYNASKIRSLLVDRACS